MCQRYDQLKAYKTSITKECMRYQNRVASAIRPSVYEVPFIGKKGGKLKSFFQHVYALLVVCVGFVFFRADTMKQGCFWIREMFTDFGWKASAMSLTLQQLTPVYLVTLAAALVAAVPVNSMLKKYKWYEGFTYVLSLAGFALCVLSLAGGTYNPFIYFRF